MSEDAMGKIMRALYEGYDVTFHNSIGIMYVRLSDHKAEPSRHFERAIDVSLAQAREIGVDGTVAETIQAGLKELQR